MNESIEFMVFYIQILNALIIFIYRYMADYFIKGEYLTKPNLVMVRKKELSRNWWNVGQYFRWHSKLLTNNESVPQIISQCTKINRPVFSWEPEHSEIQGTFRPGKTNIYLQTCSLSRCSYILIIRSPRIQILLFRYDFLKIISKAGRDHGNIKRLY